MDLLTNRLASFQTKLPDGTKKKGWPAKFKTNLAYTANFMAKIGFIHTPTKTRADCVTCSVCNLECNWSESHEHPLAFHLDNDPCWSVRLWGLAAVSRNLIEEREVDIDFGEYKLLLMKSFTESKQKFPVKSKQYPNEKQLVDAGLCYIPDDEFQDATTCPYCEIEIVGWEKGDDPLYLMIKIRKEHHDQAENCPFFSLKREYEQLKKPVVVPEKANLVVIESSEEELVAIVSQPKPKTYKSARRAKATQAKTEDIVKEDMKKPRVESSKETAATKKIKKSSDNANVSLMDSSNSAILENEIAVPATRKGGKREGKQAHEEITTSNPKAKASIVEKGAGSRVVRVKKVKSEPIVEELVEEAIISEGTITRNKEIKVKHVAKSAATQKTVITDPQRETSNLKEKDIAKATGKKNIQEEADKSSKRDAPKNIDKTTNKRQAVESRAGDKAKPIVVDDDDVQEEPKKATRKTRQKNEKAEPKSPIKKSRPSPKSKKKAIDISPRKSTEVFPDEYSQNSALDKELGNDIISEKTADVERNGFGSSNQKQVIKDTMDMAISNLIKAPSSGVDEVQEEPKKVARKTRQKIEKAPKNVEIPMPKSPIKASRQSPKSKKIPVEISPVKSTVVFPNEDDQKLALGEDVKKSSFSNDTTKLQSKNDQVIKASMELAISNFIDAPASDKNPKTKVQDPVIGNNITTSKPVTIVKIPETTKAVQVDNKRKRDEQEIPAVKKAVVDNAIKPRFTQQFSRKISAQIAPNTQNLLKPKNVDPAVEKLAASSALPRDQVYQLYDENKDLTVKEFLELLTLKTVEQMDKAFLKELQSLES